jgi:deoxycytidylate deaminase
MLVSDQNTPTLSSPAVVPEQQDTPYPDELVFAFVYAVGTQSDPIVEFLVDELEQWGYRCEPIRISDFFPPYVNRLKLPIELRDDPYDERVRTRMDAGNQICDKAKQLDFLALLTVFEINRRRNAAVGDEPRTKVAYIINSLKRPEEVALLRQTYGPGFFLIGVYAPEQERLMYLQTQKAVQEERARALLRDDQSEKAVSDYGQNTRDTYALADVFIQQDQNIYKQQLSRFIDLIFANPFITPELDEHSMFLAYTAALRSGDLSRQVGAAICTAAGDIVALGCNDVPKFGGGLYWPGDDDQRDHVRGSDSNEKRRDEIIRDVKGLIRNDSETTLNAAREILQNSILWQDPEIKDLLTKRDDIVDALAQLLRNPEVVDLETAKELLRDTPLFTLTEFGRTVHAEMDALLTCARNGQPTAGTTLYTTTFPCHNCTRHIVAAGISRVVYVEPYPKSLAFQLHYDSISLEEKGWSRPVVQGCRIKVAFEPFVGVGPRRFYDLFSMTLGAGRPIKRKEKRKSGDKYKWKRGAERPRVPMDPTSYLDREKKAAMKVDQTLESL